MRNLHNSLSYLGVEAKTPPNLTIETRDPLTTDYKKFNLGDIWLRRAAADSWMLTDKQSNVATWTKLNQSGSASFTDLEITVGPFEVGYFLEGTLRSDASGIVTSYGDGIDKEVYMGTSGGDAVWGAIESSGSTVTITRTATGINLEAAGGTAVNTFTMDSGGSASPDGAGNTWVLGGPNINTTASLNAININLDQGTKGQLLIGSDSGFNAWANLTSTDGSIIITKGDNSLDFEYNPVLTINEQVGTAYTLQLSDLGKEVQLSNMAAITLTIPTNAAVNFPEGATIILVQYDSGTVTVTPDGGVTLNSASGMTDLYEKYSSAALIRQVNPDEWLLVGDIK